MKRREFIISSIASAAATSALAATATSPDTPAEPVRRPPLDPGLVREFVGAGHGNLPRVKELLAAHPRLIHASYDWGGGDSEAALGGASHVGNRAMASFLLDSGARFDAFCAAMLGEAGIVAGLLRISPASANTRGPHGYSLLYHAGYSGNVAIAEAIGPHLTQRARDCNQALQTAALTGRTEFVAWLLKNGADDPNTKTFQGKTPLDLATQRKHADIIRLLQEAGGTRSG